MPALIVGSLIPDLEPLISFLTGGGLVPPRGFMHSLLGAVTLDSFLVVLITMFLYPVLAALVFKVEKKDVAEKCVLSGMLVLSAIIGSLSHVLIDSTSHDYNPLLYPFVTESFDALVLMNDWLLASIIVQIALLQLLLLILVREFTRGRKGIWRRLLVE